MLKTLLLCVVLAASVAAQAPAEPAPPPVDAYAYQPDGRRDPFLNLLASGTDTRRTTARPDGLAGLMAAEISVRGVLESNGQLVAMIQGPNSKTYVVRQGDQLMDGTIRSVIPEGLVIVQDVNDPLSLVKQREIRRLLRSVEDSRQ
jgi:Tfp pilus assembly protein PilP